MACVVMKVSRIPLALLFPLLILAGMGLSKLRLSALLPTCLFHEWTGLHCPGCGGTRAFHALADADPLGALRMNPLGVLLIVGVALLALRTSWEALFPDRKWLRLPYSDRWAWWGIAVVGLFFVARNLPWWPFTQLAPH